MRISSSLHLWMNLRNEKTPSGNLRAFFEKMALEVRAREQRLKRQLQQLKLDIEEKQMARAETVVIYIPMDRRQAMAHGKTLPEYAHGTALFATYPASQR